MTRALHDADVKLLAFDTSGPWITLALSDGAHLRSRHKDMARGQAERLMVSIDEMLRDHGLKPADLDAIAVGVGPGNFTGIRIGVSAARGMALGLGVPAIGVSQFEIWAGDAGDVLTCLPAPRGQIYVQCRQGGTDSPPRIVADIEGLRSFPELAIAGPDAERIATALGRNAKHRVDDIPLALTGVALRKLRQKCDAPPAPLYVRPVDAAPPREAPPRILDDV